MPCILCMKDSKQVIDIFDEDGIRLNISSTISQHFWLEPSKSNADNQVICVSCWEALDSFHTFYEEVKEAHNMLLNAVLDPHKEVKGEIPSYTGDLDAIQVDLLVTDFKVENCEGSEDDPPNIYLETKLNPLEVIERTDKIVQDLKYDSESEIPLSRLAEYGEHDASDIDSEPVSKKRRRKEQERKTKKQMRIASSWKARGINDKIVKQNMKLSCDLCDVLLENFPELQEHFQSVHNTRGYVVCCNRKFFKRSDLVGHILLHKNPEHFKCDECEKVLTNRNTLREHKRMVHNKQFNLQCDKCNKIFLRKQQFIRHMDTHVIDRKFQCEQCEKLFTSKFTLGQHIYSVHKKKVCEQCGKVTHNQEAFQQHMLEHTNDPKPIVVKCGECGISLKHEKGLRRHMKSMHTNPNVTHACNLCGKVLSSLFSLKRHVAYMHNNVGQSAESST